MSKKTVEIDDVLEVISDLTVMVSEGFDRLDKGLAENNKGLAENNKGLAENNKGLAENNSRLNLLEKAQIETNTRLDRIEGTLEAIQADIKELYKMISGLRKDMDKSKLHWRQLEKRVSKVEAFALVLSKQTGINFK